MIYNVGRDVFMILYHEMNGILVPNKYISVRKTADLSASCVPSPAAQQTVKLAQDAWLSVELQGARTPELDAGAVAKW